MATAPESTAPAAKKAVTVIEGMDSRRIFNSGTAALAYLNESADKYADFANHPMVANGLIADDDGNPMFDPAVYTDGLNIMVSVLANRAKTKGDPSTVKSIVVTPIPSFESILEDESARKWLQRIAEKELNHVAVRALRNADDVSTVADQMPLTLADYITSSRESSGGIMETFDKLFRGIINGLAAKSPVWARARLIKTTLRQAFESKAYALSEYPKLEDRGDGRPSLFVMALQLGIRTAEEQGLDPAIFKKWFDERDTKAFTIGDDEEDSDDFDLDDIAFVAPEAKADDKPAEPAADATA